MITLKYLNESIGKASLATGIGAAAGAGGMHLAKLLAKHNTNTTLNNQIDDGLNKAIEAYKVAKSGLDNSKFLPDIAINKLKEALKTAEDYILSHGGTIENGIATAKKVATGVSDSIIDHSKDFNYTHGALAGGAVGLGGYLLHKALNKNNKK